MPQTCSLVTFACLGFLFLSAEADYSKISERIHYASSSLRKRQTDGDANFNWTSIEPSSDLIWTPCYGSFECARFTVPLDYSDPNGRKAAIAITKLPSSIPPGQDGYKGPILLNPGGPGGSGVQYVLEEGQAFSEEIGYDFDFVGFDPRGLGFSTPGLFAFQSGPEEAILSNNFRRAANETSGSIGSLYAEAQTIGKVAKDRIGNVGRFVSTPAAARDMLAITRAFGYEKLQYWGISFAAMFPDNVGRLIIDGVADAESYYKGQYGHDLLDTDKVLLTIYQACVGIGPSECPIYESSTEKISSRVNNLLESLKTQPLSFYNATTGEYGVLDYSAAKGAIFSTLYSPHQNGAALTFALAAAEKGDSQSLFDTSSLVSKSSQYACDSFLAPSVSYAGGLETTLGIACGDSGTNMTLDETRALYAKMAEDSHFAEMWPIYLGCSGWQISAKERFSATFNTSTRFPLLVIGNTADPVTPLANARKMSQFFTNSILLTQDSPGHTSLAASSKCTTSVIRDYFRDGKLPSKGTVCNVESSIFGTVSNGTSAL